jgi:hypothetical protein
LSVVVAPRRRHLIRKKYGMQYSFLFPSPRCTLSLGDAPPLRPHRDDAYGDNKKIYFRVTLVKITPFARAGV